MKRWELKAKLDDEAAAAEARELAAHTAYAALTPEQRASHTAAVHMVLCHHNGEPCPDGCDEAADPKQLARYLAGEFDQLGIGLGADRYTPRGSKVSK